MNKAIFLDRDGTINIDNNYIYKPEDFIFIDGAVEGLKKLQDRGFLLVIITNQSGIARGYYSENDYKILNTYMNERLSEYGIYITKDYYCPHLPNAIVSKYSRMCSCRKPGTELFERAVNELDIDLSKSFCIGDRLRDLAICQKSECKGYLIGKTENDENISKVKDGSVSNIKYYSSLLDAARDIEILDIICKA